MKQGNPAYEARLDYRVQSMVTLLKRMDEIANGKRKP